MSLCLPSSSSSCGILINPIFFQILPETYQSCSLYFLLSTLHLSTIPFLHRPPLLLMHLLFILCLPMLYQAAWRHYSTDSARSYLDATWRHYESLLPIQRHVSMPDLHPAPDV
ncbi:hypothetical protein XENORESO_004547 [Xenotaenia resolanae]|uniref:Uncharacterized protein n=1 Tax=Xenotaenia resolanae TaxID=208358 RepID=A0ABV0WXX3_9TELE